MLLDTSHITRDKDLLNLLDQARLEVEAGVFTTELEPTPNRKQYDPYYVSQEYLNDLRVKNPYLDVNEASKLSSFDFKDSPTCVKIIDRLFTHYNKHLIQNSGHFVYPSDNGYMGWHTNIGSIGIRLYCVYVAESDKSYFGYWDGQQVIQDWDKAGWNIRAFDINKQHPFWHCVYATTNRYSFGFRIRQVMK